MFHEISEWLDEVLEDISDTGIPNEVIAFGFNLYDGCNGEDWSMELIGTSEFDTDDEDWLCNEVTDFDTRDNPFQWSKKAKWEEILNPRRVHSPMLASQQTNDERSESRADTPQLAAGSFIDVTCSLERYLESGKYADVLKAKSGVGVGFVDGNINILYSRNTF